MSIERMSVSLDDFLKYILKKWYIVIVCIIVSCVLFGISTIAFGNKIEVPASEEYLYLKEQEKSFQEYIDNSIVMQMDPVNIFEKVVFIENILNVERLKDFVESGNVWKSMEDTLDVKYLSELLSWEKVENTEIVEVKIRHSEKEQCEELTEYIAEQLRKEDENITVTVGSLRTVIDETMANRQTWYLNRLEDVKGQLEYTAMGYVIEVTPMMIVAIGILFGGLLVTVALFLAFLFNNKIRSIDEMKYYTKAEILGKSEKIREKREIPALGSSEFEKKIKLKFEIKENIILINLSEQTIGISGIKEVSGVTLNNREKEQILSARYVLIGMSANQTLYKELRKILKYLAENEKEVNGCIAC